MITKQTLLATFMGGLTLFFLGWIFYDMIAGEFFTNDALTPVPMRMDMAAIALGCLVEAFVMTHLFLRWTTNDNSVFAGGKFGAWLGVCMGLGVGIVTYGTMEMHSLNAHLLDALWSIVFYGLAGVVIAWSTQLMQNSTPTEN